MKPDAYMPFYFRAFFEAIKGQPPYIGMGYLVAICYYWGHNNCEGLKDDDEFLRRVCEIDKLEWKEAKAFIFDGDKCFTQDANGIWHQKRAYEEWHKAKTKYEKFSKSGSKGGTNRWKKWREKHAK